MSLFVRFSVCPRVFFVLFRITGWPSSGKEMSAWLFACLVLYLTSSLVCCVPFRFDVLASSLVCCVPFPIWCLGVVLGLLCSFSRLVSWRRPCFVVFLSPFDVLASSLVYCVPFPVLCLGVVLGLLCSFPDWCLGVVHGLLCSFPVWCLGVALGLLCSFPVWCLGVVLGLFCSFFRLMSWCRPWFVVFL